eukprot:TRINITY_DN32756_c0_g1_i1.p1 TRINITY_DN32756_c0_g1~~TRINITY_DN32756_c0_g1_i1.p1  ORF type:complete len:915 (+),score=120.06 TRINITY_DN32756_c0_g1_i1:113-2857(+)
MPGVSRQISGGYDHHALPGESDDLWTRCMRRYVNGVARCPTLWLVVIAMVTAAFVMPAARLMQSCQNIYSQARGSPSYHAKRKLEEVFGHAPMECDVLLVRSKTDLLDSPTLAVLDAEMTHFLEQNDLDVNVTGYLDVDKQGLQDIAKRFISDDHKSSVYVISRFGVPINKTIGRAENALVEHLQKHYVHADGGGMLTYVGIAGIAPFVVEGVKTARDDLERMNPVSIPLCFAVLAYVLWSWRLMCVPMGCLVVANVLCFGIMTLCAEYVTTVSTSVPSLAETLLVALTFDYSLFLLTRFREEVEDGQSVQEAVMMSMINSGRVIVGSGVTVCFCVMAIQVLPVDEARCVSLAATVAVVVAMTVNLSFTPALLLACPEFFKASATVRPEAESLDTPAFLYSDTEQANDKKADTAAADGKGPNGEWLTGLKSYLQCKAAKVRQMEADEEKASVTPSPPAAPLSAAARKCLAKEAPVTFWDRWSRICVTPWASRLALILLVVTAIVTGKILSLMDASADFFLMGSSDSHILQTLKHLGDDFSQGYVGQVTLVLTAREQGLEPVYKNNFWMGAKHMLRDIDEKVMSGEINGSIVSPMYFSSATTGRYDIPVSWVVSADDLPGSKMTFIDDVVDTLEGNFAPRMKKELKYVIDNSLNAAKSAAIATIAPNVRTTSKEAVAWTRAVRTLLEANNKNPDSHFDAYMFSQTSEMIDVEEVVYSSVPLFVGVSLLGCLLFVTYLFSSFVIALRSVVSIAFTMAIVFSVATLIYQYGWFGGGTEGLFFMAPVMTFTIVVGLALDYDIFLLGRIEELRLAGLDSQTAIAEGVAQTGHVITCAGIIMTIAFGGLLMSKVPSLHQVSCIFATAVLLDTFVVRTVVTPALMALMGEANWWPRTMPPVSVWAGEGSSPDKSTGRLLAE